MLPRSITMSTTATSRPAPINPQPTAGLSPNTTPEITKAVIGANGRSWFRSLVSSSRMQKIDTLQNYRPSLGFRGRCCLDQYQLGPGPFARLLAGVARRWFWRHHRGDDERHASISRAFLQRGHNRYRPGCRRHPGCARCRRGRRGRGDCRREACFLPRTGYSRLACQRRTHRS